MNNITPASILTTQGGKGIWASTYYMKDVVLGISKVRANMLKRCVRAILKHEDGAEVAEHPDTRVYHVTSDTAFYRKGARQMVRVTLGHDGSVVIVANNTHQTAIPFNLMDLAEVKTDTLPEVVAINVLPKHEETTLGSLLLNKIEDSKDTVEVEDKERAAKDKKNAAARNRRAKAKAEKEAQK